MRKTTLYLSAVLAVARCASNPGKNAGMVSETEAPTTATGETSEAAVRASMHGHDKHGDAMRDAMVRGDLDGAKAEAKLLAELRVAGPTRGLFRHLLGAMKDAAAQASGVGDLRGASYDVAIVARSCGDCHQMFGRPGTIVGQPAAPAPGVRASMQRHQWAAEQLWEGLVVPSDEAWSAGALALADAPLSPEALAPGEALVPRVGELAQTVHDLGRKAAAVDRVDARAELYGQMLVTCADCHKWLGGGPTPP